MKQRSTSLIYAILALLTLSFTSCEEEEAAVPVAPEAEETEDLCRMTAITFDGEAPITISYNEKGYIKELRTTSTSNDGTVYVITAVYTYDNNNQLIREESYTNGKMNEYTIYENENGLQVSARNYEYIEGRAEGDLLTTKTFQYDANKRLVEINKVHASSNNKNRIRFTYDAKGNVEMEEHYTEEGWVAIRVILSDYDDKPTPFSVAKGLPNFDEDGISQNNPGKITRYFFSKNNGVVEENGVAVNNLVYEYNDRGFPTKITETEQEDNSRSTMTFSYECN